MSRLNLTHLTFIGIDREPASVDFGPRLTLIRGPSDTGKSFIVDAIDFMLGASALKEIPERQGYSTVLLGLEFASGERVTLSRSVNGGNIGLHMGDIRSGAVSVPDESLGPKHNARNENNLSRFLLGQIGLDGKKVRRNVHNATDSLSFRNIAHLCVIDETQMQSEISPALTGSYVSKTKEISVLKLLLQDEDDSDLVESQSKTERSRLSDAQVEVIDRLRAEVEAQLNDEPEEGQLREQLARLNRAVEEQGTSIGRLTVNRDRLAVARTEAQNQEEKIRQQLADGNALNARFNLLLEQYNSDLARLEMISEAGNLLGFFERGTCVFCGATPEHQHLNDVCEGDATYFSESVEAERQKTTGLRDDLIATLADLEEERLGLQRTLRQTRKEVALISDRLNEADLALQPQRGDLNDLIATRVMVEKTLGLYDQIANLERIKTQIMDDSKTETATAAAGLDLGALREFSSEIQNRLVAWGIPDASTVRYDRSEQDIIAGDQLRAAHGKGVRAILHAAFSVGLLQYCLDRDIAHPGFVVLDSPLVTYRPPDVESADSTEEENVLPNTVVGAFYGDMQTNIDGQVIVMENIDPPDSLDNNTTDIIFTKVIGSGRYGFFPVVGGHQPSVV